MYIQYIDIYIYTYGSVSLVGFKLTPSTPTVFSAWCVHACIHACILAQSGALSRAGFSSTRLETQRKSEQVSANPRKSVQTSRGLDQVRRQSYSKGNSRY